jgi:hypothetical protein|tara:strand:- start:133 stop:309 length:177 start_codon:yes stop_codon:yes gene_type:complete
MAKVKGVNISSLNKRQQTAMKKHAKHHTAKHIKSMVAMMNRGSTFTESHKKAMNKVGR